MENVVIEELEQVIAPEDSPAFQFLAGVAVVLGIAAFFGC